MSRRGLHFLVLCSLALAVGCSWFVDPLDGSELRCAMDAGADAGNFCPEGLTCQEGLCQPAKPECRPVEEVCGDNVDNDCDGFIDEIDPKGRDLCGDKRDNDCDGLIDEDSDRDQDGFNWCGDPADDSVPRDCDDFAADVSPMATEICDGVDNDCDGRTDNPKPGQGSLCEVGKKCVDGECVALTCANDPAFKCAPGTACSVNGKCEPVPVGCANIVCPAGQECRDAACVPRQKRANGGPCLDDVDCLSGVCMDAEALRLAGTGICGRSCCNDLGCGEGEICFASGRGARSCLPRSMVPSSVQPQQCTDNAFCGEKNVCALENDQTLTAPFSTTESLTTAVCQPPGGARKLGDYCPGGATSCESHTCVTGAVGFICSKPCGHSQECADFTREAPFNPLNAAAYCRYVPVRSGEGLRKPDFSPVCMLRRSGETGPKERGEACMSANECRDRGCVGILDGRPGRCAVTCCDDSQCVSESAPPGTCRPFKVGMGYEMRCDDQRAPTQPLPTSAQSR